MHQKRFLYTPMLLLCLILAACGEEPSYDEEALRLRTDYLAMQSCQGTAEITADYGQRVYDYTVDFSWQREGEAVITIKSPQEVAGITARLGNGESQMEFDGVALETGPLSEDGFAPGDCIPAMIEAIQTGYIAQSGEEERDGITCLRLQIRNPDNPVGTGRELSIWLDPQSSALVAGEVAQDSFTVIHCKFTDFTIEIP